MGDAAAQKGNQLVEIVDENDSVIGTTQRWVADRDRLRMRAAKVIVLDRKKRILVQQRALEKSVYPGLYDPTVGEIAYVGEPYDVTASRGTHEEILPDAPIEMVNRYLRHLCALPPFEDEQTKRNYQIYLFSYDEHIHGIITPEKSEIMGVQWVTAPKLEEILTIKNFSPIGRILGRIATSLATGRIGELQYAEILADKVSRQIKGGVYQE